jgi:hypothetical protein
VRNCDSNTVRFFVYGLCCQEKAGGARKEEAPDEAPDGKAGEKSQRKGKRKEEELRYGQSPD